MLEQAVILLIAAGLVITASRIRKLRKNREIDSQIVTMETSEGS